MAIKTVTRSLITISQLAFRWNGFALSPFYWKILFYLIHLNLIIRLLLTSYIYQSDKVYYYSIYQTIDQMATAFIEQFRTDIGWAAIMAALYVAFALFIDAMFYLFENGINYQVYYSLVEANATNLVQANEWLGQLKHQLIWHCSHLQISAARKCFNELIEASHKEVVLTPLDHFHQLSVKNRIQMWLFSEALNVAFSIASITVAIALTTLAVLFIKYILCDFTSIWYFWFGFFDLVCITYITWNAIRLCLYGLHYPATVAFGTWLHMKQLTGNLQTSLNKKRKNANLIIHHFTVIQHEFHLAYTIARHNSITVAYSLFISIITTLGVNIWMVTLLVYGQLNIGQRLLFVLILILQSSILFNYCQLYIFWSNTLHMVDKLLYRLQLSLGGESHNNNGIIKMKILVLYELIHCRGRFKFAITCVGRLSKWAMFEFYWAYTAYLMAAFGAAKSTFLVEVHVED